MTDRTPTACLHGAYSHNAYTGLTASHLLPCDRKYSACIAPGAVVALHDCDPYGSVIWTPKDSNSNLGKCRNRPFTCGLCGCRAVGFAARGGTSQCTVREMLLSGFEGPNLNAWGVTSGNSDTEERND